MKNILIIIGIIILTSCDGSYNKEPIGLITTIVCKEKCKCKAYISDAGTTGNKYFWMPCSDTTKVGDKVKIIISDN